MAGISGHLNECLLGSTPLERWDAVSRYSSDSGTSLWIILTGLALIAMLTALLIFMHYRKKQSSPVSSRQRFDENARSKELTDRQYRLLTQIAANAQLKREESIFTLPTVFDREVSKIIENAKTKGQSDAIVQLEAELAALRDKLDFRQYTPLAVATPQADTNSTRQIPLKKKIYIKRNHRSANGDLLGTVIDNTPAGLIVQFPAPVEVIFGQSWICRYHTGAFVAEFLTTPVKCSGPNVLLHHSNRVRLINRRKVLRVPIHKPAYIAAFPFKKEAFVTQIQRQKTAGRLSRNAQGFEALRFLPAIITEIGGPGLRIRTKLNLRIHDRVLVMFKLEQFTGSYSRGGRKNTTEQVIEHIAKVRHIIKDQNGPSVALELIGLSDNEIDELIRITNEISIRMRNNRPNIRVLETDSSSGRKLVKV